MESQAAWAQRIISLEPKPRGFHLVTNEIVSALPEITEFSLGVAHFFIQHTSASLSLNENADPSVRSDMEQFFLRAVPDGAEYFEHTLEGDDDMPAHIKAVLVGAGVTIPIAQGRLALGAWQGIYLGEHRHHGGQRRIVCTLNGRS